MRLVSVLKETHVVLPLRASTVREAVLELGERLVETGAFVNIEPLEAQLEAERVRDIVRAGDHALIAHMRTREVDELAVALGVTEAPLPDAPGRAEGTARVVALVVGPAHQADKYLQMVAALTRITRDEQVTKRIIEATEPEAVLSVPQLRDLELPPRLAVRDVMSHRTFRVYADTPLDELMALMARHRLRAVPVVADEREVVGIVTDRDLLGYLMPRVLRAGEEEEGAEEQRTVKRTVPVREIMSRSVMCVAEEQSVADVASIMVNKDVERFPVVREGRLSGFLTRGDIIRKLFG